MSNLPKIYSNCKAGCLWRTVHYDEFLNAASIVEINIDALERKVIGGKEYICLEKDKTYVFKASELNNWGFSLAAFCCVNGGVWQSPIVLNFDKYSKKFKLKLYDVVVNNARNLTFIADINGERVEREDVSATYTSPTITDVKLCIISGMPSHIYVVNEDATLEVKSAYEVAVANGFEGTEAEWIASLKGEDGYSPAVSVVDIDGGQRVTITDKDSEKTFDVMEVPTKLSELDNDTNYVPQEYVDAQNANTLAVAEGKNKSFVCSTVALMVEQFGATAAQNNSYRFTLPDGFPETIKTGDVILIKDINVPDYWIATENGKDGSLYILETTKVDLSGYETTSHASATYATKTELGQKSNATNLLNGTAERSLRKETCEANHKDAVVYGYQNVSVNEGVFMCGSYASKLPLDGWENKLLFVVGNGLWVDTDGDKENDELIRKNAFEVRAGGDAHLQRDFYIGGSLKIGDSTITENQLKELLKLINN